MKKLASLIIGLDFDGTVVTHEYPKIGSPIDNCIPTLKRLIKAGTRICLNTMRSGKELNEAVEYLANNGIELYGVNCNPEQSEWTKSPKVYAHCYIDDAALGCPLTYDLNMSNRVFADWFRIEDMLFPIETKKVIACAKTLAQ